MPAWLKLSQPLGLLLFSLEEEACFDTIQLHDD